MSSTPKAAPASPTAVDPSRVRGVLERMQGRVLTGWAVDQHQPGQEALTLVLPRPAGRPEVRLLPLERQSRADVAHALGLAAGDYGFAALLDDEVLALLAQPEAARAHLCANGVPLHGGPPLARLMGQRLQHEGRPLGALEGLSGLHLHGWLADADAPARLSLLCNGQPLGHPVQRHAREDVCHQLGMRHPAPGFVIELPGQLWQQVPPGQDAQLQLLLNDQPLGPPQRLQRLALPTLLQARHRPVDPAQDRLHQLLVLEHLVAAGLWPQLTPAQRQPLEELTAQLGLSPLGMVAASTVDAPPEAPPQDGEAAPTPTATWLPKGRWARWLRYRWACAWALRQLQRLRERDDPRAEDLEIALTRATGLFDETLYARQVSPAQLGGLSPLAHYVRHGDALSLCPNPLLSPRGYVAQLPGRRHPGINRLLHYVLWGRFNGVSPSPWFNPAWYLRRHPDVRKSGADALRHFLRQGWHEQRPPFEGFDLQAEGRQPLVQRLARQSLARAWPEDALLAYLLRGLPPGASLPQNGRLPWQPVREIEGRDHTDPALWAHLPHPNPATAEVDVIVPVYAGVQETLACLYSVLAAPVRTRFELVVVDDCSPDPALSALLRHLAERQLITLLVNEENQGFVRTVNRGLARHPGRDVVILNADTLVFNDWLDRLLAHLSAQPRAASVTPLSNNATICSYPRPQGDNGPILASRAAELDRQAAALQPGWHVSAPSGVGFCMAMRREVLARIGPLDAEAFGRGYGEENDWCQRAIAAGWLNLLAGDVFVVHQGSVSFAEEADERVRAALRTLEQRHPGYDKRVQAWIAQNPLATARARLDMQQLVQALGGPQRPVVVQISHARGGGTARHEQELAQACRAQGQAVLKLHPGSQPGTLSLQHGLNLALPNLENLPCEVGGTLDAVLELVSLAALQLHHLADLPEAIHAWIAHQVQVRRVPLQVIVHDYHLICPRINLVTPTGRYCGEPAPVGCEQCLAQHSPDAPALSVPGGIMAWREASARLLRLADSITVPDADVAQRLVRYFPGLSTQVRPHERELRIQAPRRPSLAPRRILVVGALGVIKGYDVVLALARSHTAQRLGLDIALLGYSKDDDALRQAGVQVLGRYDDATLVQSINQLEPDLVFLPSIWPETYCYVLSAALQANVQVVSFNIGAQARRLRNARVKGRLLPLELADRPEDLALALGQPA